MEYLILLLLIIGFSVILHEIAHGYAAYVLGDPTAHHQGRLTLNPLVHIDIFGTILLPLLLYFTVGILFGWAKPVPYNPYNLRGRYAEAFVAAAGVLTNIGIAVFFAMVYRFGGGAFPVGMLEVFGLIVTVNIFLAVLNLLPIPPLDGSKIISGLLPFRVRMALVERVSRIVNVNSIFFMVGVLFFIFFFALDYVLIFAELIIRLLLGG